MRVSVQKREAIPDIAKQMEDMPHIHAHTLRGETTGMVGVPADTQAPDTVHQLIQRLESKAMDHGRRLPIGEFHDSSKAMEKTWGI